MRHFKEATEKPFGYLLIDLKPTTPESMRMRTDVFVDMPIKEHKPETRSRLQRSSGEERTRLNSSCEVKSPTFEITDSSLGSAMASCDDCGLVFDSTHDLQRHIKTWCPENENRKRQLPQYDYEKPLKKKPRIIQSDEYVMNHEDDSPIISSEEDYFRRMKKDQSLKMRILGLKSLKNIETRDYPNWGQKRRQTIKWRKPILLHFWTFMEKPFWTC